MNKILYNNANDKLVMKYSDYLDYYSDIQLSLLLKDKEYILLKDNLLYLKNLISNFKLKELDSCLSEESLGKDLNIYCNREYHGICDKKWMGLEYCIHYDDNYAIWLYRKEQGIKIRVTEVLFESDFKEDLFFEKCKCIFLGEVSEGELKKIKSGILEVYNEKYLRREL